MWLHILLFGLREEEEMDGIGAWVDGMPGGC